MANSKRCDGEGVSLTYRQKRTGEMNPPWTTPPRMPRRDDVAVWKDASKVRSLRYNETYGLRKPGGWWALASKGGHRSRRYRRVWPRRGKFHRWDYFRLSSWLLFQRGGRAGTTCSVRVWTQNSRLASVCVRLLHVTYHSSELINRGSLAGLKK